MSQAAVEGAARDLLRGGFTASIAFEVVDGHEPLEVRHLDSGETFLLEVRALPTGG